MTRSQARKTAQREVQQAEVLQRFVAGEHIDVIASECGYASRQNAYRAVRNALKRRAAERKELADEALELMLSRLDRVLESHMRIATDETKPAHAARSAMIVLHTLDRIAKYVGLDQPQRTESSITTVDDVDREIAELAAKLTAKAKADGADLDVPVIEALIEHGSNDNG